MGKKIAITGGIGSGKSAVSNILRDKGYPVYSCDEIYKELINSKAYIKKKSKTSQLSYHLKIDYSCIKKANSNYKYSFFNMCKCFCDSYCNIVSIIFIIFAKIGRRKSHYFGGW